MNNVHEPGSRTMSKNWLRNSTESNRAKNRPSAPSAQLGPARAPRPRAPHAPARPLPRVCHAPAARLPRPRSAPAAPPQRACRDPAARLPRPRSAPAPSLRAQLPMPACARMGARLLLMLLPRAPATPTAPTPTPQRCVATQLPVLRHRQPCLLP